MVLKRLSSAWLIVVWMLAAQTAVANDAPVALIFGDSLSAAYGIPRDDGWVHLLQQRLRQAGYPHRIVNASVSGETTAGGLRRLPAQLERHRPDILIIELGGNDGLRGQPTAAMTNNLESMVQLGQAAGARVALLGMRIPSNYGPAYAQAFHQSYADVAEATGAALLPFFLEPIALSQDAFLPDGIHPNAGAQPRLLEHAWPALQPLFKSSTTD